jgi:hypothetical protein
MMTPTVGASWSPKYVKSYTAVNEGIRAFIHCLKVLSALRHGLNLQLMMIVILGGS